MRHSINIKFQMGKKILNICLIIATIALTNSCFFKPVPSPTNVYYETPEEAIEVYIEKEGLPPDVKYAYKVIEDHIFLLLGGVLRDGCHFEDGYLMAMPYFKNCRLGVYYE